MVRVLSIWKHVQIEQPKPVLREIIINIKLLVKGFFLCDDHYWVLFRRIIKKGNLKCEESVSSKSSIEIFNICVNSPS